MYRFGGTLRSHSVGRSHDQGSAVQQLDRRNAELEEQVLRLEARNAALEGFAAAAAHQLAEPLVVVESAAILISEDLAGVAGPGILERLRGVGLVAARGRR